MVARGVASLTRLVVLDASACLAVTSGGMGGLVALQLLEVLWLPCQDGAVMADVAVQLPRLRSLSLCLRKQLPPGSQLWLAPAAALTELRLELWPVASATARHMQLPPSLKALRISFQPSWQPRGVVHVLNCLPIKCLVALTVNDLDADYSGPSQLLLPPVCPLTCMHFAKASDFRRLESELWPLAHLAAESSSSPGNTAGTTAGANSLSAAGASRGRAPAGAEVECVDGGWLLLLTIGGTEHELSAADFTPATMWHVGISGASRAVRGCLTSATFGIDSPIQTLAHAGDPFSVFRDIFDRETCLRRLVVRDLQKVIGSYGGSWLSKLKSLRHLAVAAFPELTPQDCAALAGLSLTALDLPLTRDVPRGILLQCLHAQARTLRQLSIYDTFGADILAAVRPLLALTMLRLRKGSVRHHNFDAPRPRSWTDLQGHEFSLRRFDVCQDLVTDDDIDASLHLMPCIQELWLAGSSRLLCSCLVTLADSCPLLRVLRLVELPRLRCGFLGPLKCLEGLAVLELREVPLYPRLLAELAASLPPNLQALLLLRSFASLACAPWPGAIDLDPEEVVPLTDSGIRAFLAALPTPPPPLRHLSLQRKSDSWIGDTAVHVIAEAGSNKLASLERLDLSETCTFVNARLLQPLLALPALVELRILKPGRTQYGAVMPADLTKLVETFAAAGRPLTVDMPAAF